MKRNRIIIVCLWTALIFCGGFAYYQEPDMQDTTELIIPTDVAVVLPTKEPTLVIVAPQFSGISDAELIALQTLYDQMTEYGKNNSGWFTSYTPCDGSWQGLTCSADGIAAFEIRAVGWFCTIPEAISTLPNLQELRLTDLGLRGVLPQDLLNMEKLETLEINGNFLTGTLPAPDFEKYSFMRVLHAVRLNNNQYTSEKAAKIVTNEYIQFCGSDLMDRGSMNLPEILDNQLLDLNPGLDGTIPATWGSIASLQQINLSGNDLSGLLPDSLINLTLKKIDLSTNNNDAPLEANQALYECLAAVVDSNLDGVRLIGVATETPIVIDTVTAVTPTQIFVTETAVATEISHPTTDKPTAQPLPPIYPSPTFTPIPPQRTNTAVIRFLTATPAWYTATPNYVYYTATPLPYRTPSWIYPTAPSYYYPTVVIYPTRQPGQPTWQPADPTEITFPTPDIAQLYEFNYSLENMTSDNIPMQWRNLEMQSYMINYLDTNGQLYPGFAMPWTIADQICNLSACEYRVNNLPQQLIDSGVFFLQLQGKDRNEKIIQSQPVGLKTDGQSQQPDMPELTHRQPWFVRFFNAMFGSLFNLFR